MAKWLDNFRANMGSLCETERLKDELVKLMLESEIKKLKAEKEE